MILVGYVNENTKHPIYLLPELLMPILILYYHKQLPTYCSSAHNLETDLSEVLFFKHSGQGLRRNLLFLFFSGDINNSPEIVFFISNSYKYKIISAIAIYIAVVNSQIFFDH